MRLLPKKQVIASLALQKKNEIDSGLNLAKKVDALRDTLGKEEANLLSFRSGTIATVQAEIDQKVRELEGVKREIQVRSAELLELQKPLDFEWNLIHRKQEELEIQKINLLSRIEAVSQQEKVHTTNAYNIELEKARMADIKRTEQELLEIASAKEREADAKLQKANQVEYHTNIALNEREVNVRQREEAVQNGFDSIERRRKQQDERDLEFVAREKLLADQTATLARNIKRYG